MLLSPPLLHRTSCPLLGLAPRSSGHPRAPNGTMVPSQFTMSPFEFQKRHIPSLVVLCLLLLEYAGTCRFEFTYIWRRPFNTYKVAFVLSRYFEIIGKVAHYCLLHLVLARSPNGLTPQRCALWYTFLYSQCMAMVIILDTILFLRVYALYQQKPLVSLLILPSIIPDILGIYNTWNVCQHAATSFNEVCDAAFDGRTLSSGVALSITFVISHGLLWLFVYRKRNVGHGRAPVVRLVVQEGTWIFVLMFAIVTATIPMDVASHAINPFIHFVCPSTLISILNCRIIQNMHRLAVDTSSGSDQSAACDDAFRLTTFISTESFDTRERDDSISATTMPPGERA